MTDINPKFSLYHLTLRSPNGSIGSILGNFSGNKKSQEIVIATQTSIELWQFNKSNSELVCIHSQQMFANIQSLSSFGILKSAKDYIVVTSDSGSLSIFQFDPLRCKFTPISNEINSKTGLRRLSPSAYICSDPKGRALMVSALERTKIVYTIVNDPNFPNRFSLSSPIEGNRNGVITYEFKSMDVGYENPIFAAIEADYNDESSKGIKSLNYYEFDMGLNNIMLLDSQKVDYSSNHIVAVPGGLDGPSGILLCAEGVIQYMCPFRPNHYVPLPMRKNNGDIKSIIIASVVHRMKTGFFILLQNQFGDIFKVNLEFKTSQETLYDTVSEHVGPGLVTSLRVRYFDTIPVATSLLILRSGHLFADSEHGDRNLYQFEKLGNNEDEKEWNSQDYLDGKAALEEELNEIEFEVKDLDNIKMVCEQPILSPMMDMKISRGDFLTAMPELYTATGTNSRSALKILHKYIELSEIVTQDLPSKILNAFTCKIHKTDQYDKFIVLSFFDGSIILKIGEEVEEAENSGFIDTVTTLNVYQIGDSSIVQIHATGLKQIFYSEEDEPLKTFDWNPPPGIEVLSSSCTNTQVVLALTNGDVVYLELSNDTNTLIEHPSPKAFNSSIIDISFMEIPTGRIAAPYLVVTCRDATIHVLSTDPKSTLVTTFTTNLYAVASSVAITSFKESSYATALEDVDDLILKGTDTITTYVHVGLQNGVYVRYVLTQEGKLDGVKMKYIAPSPLKIATIQVTNKTGEYTTLAVINALTSYFVVPESNGNIKLVPLPIPEKFVEIDADGGDDDDDNDEDDNDDVALAKSYGCIVPLHSADVPQGMILTHAEKLTIASVPVFNAVDSSKLNADCQSVVLNKLRNLSNIESINLRYTPRAMCDDLEEKYKMSYIVCSDSDIATVYGKTDTDDGGNSDEIVTYGTAEDEDEILAKEVERVKRVGYARKSTGFASCIHVYSIENAAIGQTIELLNDVMAFRVGTAKLEHNGKVADFLFVSTIKKFDIEASTIDERYESCFVRVYRVEEDGSLQYVYQQEFPVPVLAIHAFQGYVAFGFGNELGIYQLGKLQMLRKAGIRLSGLGVREIVDIQSSGMRMFISDIKSSVRMLVYDTTANIFAPLVDDMVDRHVSRSLVLDKDTIFVGDKFGNLSVLRTPTVDLEIVKGKQMSKLMNDRLGIAKVAQIDEKFELLMSFYVGDVITSLNRRKIGIASEEVIIYGGINGTIGALTAMKSIKEVNFFREMEKLMIRVMQGMKIGELDEIDSQIDEKNENVVIDRDILKFRSYYVPKTNCIDGDLIEMFHKLDGITQRKVAKCMDRTVDEIMAKIIELRDRVSY